MRINRLVFYISQLVLFLLILGVVGGALWYFLKSDVPEVTDVNKEAQISRLDKSAQSYYSKLLFYTGVCADIGVPDGFRCNESDEAFVVETRLSDGRFYCADSTGFIGRADYSFGDGLACWQ